MESIQQLTHSEALDQADKMSGYYRLHAKIYDLTRWTFLFGRKWILDWLPFSFSSRPHIVEIGCGTGYNMEALSERFPKSRLTGIDISAEMLDIADRKLMLVPNHVVLRQKNYGSERLDFEKVPDCILFSYCLTMVNPDWEKLIIQAKNDLHTEGVIAVVDFHQSPVNWFKNGCSSIMSVWTGIFCLFYKPNLKRSSWNVVAHILDCGLTSCLLERLNKTMIFMFSL